MNKRVYILIGILFIIAALFLHIKKEKIKEGLYQKSKNLTYLQKMAADIKIYEKRYKKSLKNLKKLNAVITKNGGNIRIYLKNLDEKGFKKSINLIFSLFAEIKEFKIEKKDNKIDIYAEIKL